MSEGLKATHDGSYTHLDRYRDFRAVFGTEQGKRVFDQIMAMSHKPVTEKDVESPGVMAFRAGMRAVGVEIHNIVTTIPREIEKE